MQEHNSLGIECPECKIEVYPNRILHTEWCGCGHCWVEHDGNRLSFGYEPGRTPKLVTKKEELEDDEMIIWT